MDETTPLCLLLLPDILEQVPFADRARDLLRAPAVVAVEPSRLRARRVGDALAATQARRLAKKLPATPRVVVVLSPVQYPLARAILARNPGCELWYGPPDGGSEHDARLGDLDTLARGRAVLTFDQSPPEHGEAPHQRNDPLWTRLEELGVARR